MEGFIGNYTFDVIDRLNCAADEATIFGELKAVMIQFGFHALLVSGVPVPGERMEPLVMANLWPHGWCERYMSRNYATDDPTLRRLRQSHRPFIWSETRTPSLSLCERRILDESAEFGLHDGLIIPIHTGLGIDAGVSFGGDRVDLGKSDITALHMIGLYGYEALRRIKPLCVGESVQMLTSREQECVKWTAAGKTAWEIGQILGISEPTVNQYIKTAARKMNTVSKGHLVARCMRAGLIV